MNVTNKTIDALTELVKKVGLVVWDFTKKVIIVSMAIGFLIANPILTAIFIGGYFGLRRYKNNYFNGEEFGLHKEKTNELVKEYNDLANYIEEVNKNNTVGFKNMSHHSNIAEFINTSTHSYKRDKHTDTVDSNVRQSTLNIVRSASREPIKYLEKYFILGDEEESLSNAEEKLENLVRLRNAIDNLEMRKSRIEDEFHAPYLINKLFRKELENKIGIDVPEIVIKHPEYIFEYVSDGGNSSQKTVITLNEEVLEETILYLSEKIDRKKSASYQRNLMTPKLRQKIKERDNYTCQSCEVSVYDQDLLLLEIDHIIPVSKGGLSTEDNLQTLCWKCNRTKSDKIL